MKSIRSLFMFAIGMMVFTATTTTTAKLEQKQNTELVKEFTVPAYEVSVVNEIKVVTVVVDAKAQSKKDQSTKTPGELESLYAVVTDVGWRVPGIKYTTIHYKEKLLDQNKINVYLIHKGNISIRDNC